MGAGCPGGGGGGGICDMGFPPRKSGVFGADYGLNAAKTP
jgi:hypothetical protein